jgi:integrase/recombinase XerD
MKKLKMTSTALTFEEGCNKYLEYCRQRNLKQGTINHYKQSYTQFYKFFDPKMPIEDITENTYKAYVLHLKSTLNNDISINSYLRDLITTLHFFMNDDGYIPHFKMQAIKADKSHHHSRILLGNHAASTCLGETH